MQKNSKLKCEICASSVFKIIDQNLNMLPPIDYPLLGKMDLNYCSNCGFVSNCTENTIETYNVYYQTLNKHNKRDSEILKQLDSKYFLSIVESMEQLGIKFQNSKILDYGSGADILSEILGVKGVQTIINFDVGDRLDEDNFDVIFSTHCFEHLLHPKDELLKLTDKLGDEGYVVIACPDLSTYDQHYYGPYNHFDLEHINHFSPYSLTKLFHEIGLDVIFLKQGKRQVNESISYSDLLVIGRKSKKISSSLSLECNPISFNWLNNFLSKNARDFEVVKSLIRLQLHKIDNSKEIQIMFYGLSSYAFRVFYWLNTTYTLDIISYFADSNLELNKMRMTPSSRICSFDETINLVTKYKDSIEIFIVAVNSHRILEMFNLHDLFDATTKHVIGHKV